VISIKDLKFENGPLGFYSKVPFQTGAVHVFYSKKISVEQFKQLPYFNKLKIKVLHQVHGDKIIKSEPSAELNFKIDQLEVADAHWTDSPNLALCIRTADCLPIMFWCPITKRVAAIHSGWRGVALNLATKCLAQLIQSGSPVEQIACFIGPHIQLQSFEVSLDVRDELLKSLPNNKTCQDTHQFYVNSKNAADKFFVDLNKIVRQQLKSHGLQEQNINSLDLDTFTHPELDSYRRDKDKSGRMISFIALEL
jgi:YfiH family protein